MIPPGFKLVRAWRPMPIDALASLAWLQRTVRVFGREHAMPRLTAWYGSAAYAYSGIEHKPAPMPPTIDAIRRDIEALTGASFNSCLANLYRNGRDSIAWHADDEPELGEEPTIASLSLGASRAFAVRERGGPIRWRTELGGGDLLVMSGRSQVDFLHALPKTARHVGPRINLTFRMIKE